MRKYAFYSGLKTYFEKKSFSPIGALIGAGLANKEHRMEGAGHGALEGIAIPTGAGLGGLAGYYLGGLSKNKNIAAASTVAGGILGALAGNAGLNSLYAKGKLNEIYEKDKKERELTPEEYAYYQALQQQGYYQ